MIVKCKMVVAVLFSWHAVIFSIRGYAKVYQYANIWGAEAFAVDSIRGCRRSGKWGLFIIKHHIRGDLIVFGGHNGYPFWYQLPLLLFLRGGRLLLIGINIQHRLIHSDLHLTYNSFTVSQHLMRIEC